MTCFQRGFIAQLVEHRTGIAEVMGPNPVEASKNFLGFICNCFLDSFLQRNIESTNALFSELELTCHEFREDYTKILYRAKREQP